MSRLGLLGAAAGLGKGMVANAEHQQRVDIEALETAKALRLQQLALNAQKDMQTQELGARREMQSEELGARREMQSEEIGARRELQSEEIGARRELQGEELGARATEGDKNRQTQRDLARISASARTGGAGRAQSRWQGKTITLTRPGRGGIPEQYQSIALFDRVTGSTYVQQGDKFVAQNADPASVRRAPQAAVGDLLKQPSLAADFVEAYGYLPQSWFTSAQQQNQLMLEYGGGSSSSESGPAYREDDEE